MACACVICSGEGFCSHLLSIIVSVTFSVHAFGFFSPYWMCEDSGCRLRGLFFRCNDGSCTNKVEDDSLLTMAVIVLISSLVLSLMLCVILNCTSYKYRKMSPTLALVTGGWYLVQEVLTTGILITVATKYDRIGWSAYVFTVPGIVFLGIVIFVLVYMWCSPQKTVSPAPPKGPN